jgi:cob(I)alamin adenosyltransferase
MKATSYSSKDAERHAEKMRKIKAARDKMMENKTEEKGLIIVNTGAGKGNLLLDLA